MAQILCPYCFTKHKVTSKSNTCPNVKSPIQGKQEEIPDLFVKEYQREKPVWLTAIGFSQHGKTCYMAALADTIENVNRIWSKTTYRFLDQHTLDTLQNVRQQVISGEMPKSTDIGIPRPIFIRTSNIPKFGTKCLVLYDTAGQLYEKLYTPENEMRLRPIKVTTNIWFFVSLKDLQDTKSRLQDLLTVYLDGMDKLGCSSLKGRNLIVVYTKADTLIDNPNYDIPKSVSDYITKDPLQNLRNLSGTAFDGEDFIENYLVEMQKISDDLREFTRAKSIDGNAFINLAEESGLNVYFSIVSALGADPKQGKLLQSTVRYRVLDPYFWALYLNTGDKNTDVNILLDGSTNSSPLYSYDLHALVENVQEKADTTTYVLGQIDKASVVGQTPPKKKPDISRPRLLGPILEQAENDTMFIIFTTGKILDIEDYSTPAWHQRILLISVGKENFHSWPNRFTLHPGDDISVVYDEIAQFFEDK